MLRLYENSHPSPPMVDDHPETPDWHDLLEAALTALWPSDQRLEEFLDQYERLP